VVVSATIQESSLILLIPNQLGKRTSGKGKVRRPISPVILFLTIYSIKERETASSITFPNPERRRMSNDGRGREKPPNNL